MKEKNYVLLFWSEYGASIFINVHFFYGMLLLSWPVELLEHVQVYSNKSEWTKHVSCDTLTKRRRQGVKTPNTFMFVPHLWDVFIYESSR